MNKLLVATAALLTAGILSATAQTTSGSAGSANWPELRRWGPGNARE